VYTSLRSIVVPLLKTDSVQLQGGQVLGEVDRLILSN